MLSAPLQLNTVRDLIEMRFTNFVQLWITKVNNFLQRLEAFILRCCVAVAIGILLPLVVKIERLNFHLGPKNWRDP